MTSAGTTEVWLILGESACDEHRNGENDSCVAQCVHGFSFDTAHDAALFMEG